MNDLPSITRGSGVPEPNPRLHWVETVEANSKIRFRVWSPAIWEFWTHFTGKTRPCFTDHKMCYGGHDEATLRWYGYLFGYHEIRRTPAFIQLTTGAARMFLNQVAKGASLRGMVIDVQRGASKKGPQYLQVAQYVNTGQDQMGQDVDPQLSCFRMWKVNHLGHVNKLKLVSGPEDIPADPTDPGCLKTDQGALSSKDGKRASRTKSRSRKPERKLKTA